MTTTTTHTSNWTDGQYVVSGPGYEWHSCDGDRWVDRHGSPVTSAQFAASAIALCGGPRDGETVS